MVATHNMKVNGRWVRAGETYGEPETVKEETAEAVEEKAAEAVETETKPKPTSRRKVSK